LLSRYCTLSWEARPLGSGKASFQQWRKTLGGGILFYCSVKEKSDIAGFGSDNYAIIVYQEKERYKAGRNDISIQHLFLFIQRF